VARSKDALEKIRAEYPDQVKVVAGDLADFSLGENAVDLAASTWRRLDGLIINHGILDPVKRVIDCQAEEWRTSFDINVFSTVALVRINLVGLL
jgi:NADP-dependent 3-hydroxy acid dehydrogenase YdfG